jgi:NitT/TauT family transport system ATP-binding protein
MDAPPKLSVRNLGKSFRKDDRPIEVLRDVSVDIAEGEFVSIVGASGCGKTTFLRLIDQLIEPTTGQVVVDGRIGARPGVDIGFVFQQDGLLPWRNILDNTMFGPEIQRHDKKKARLIAQDLLRLVGLSGFEGHYPHELSGGMRQRVNIARALCIGADILLMDEPFAALDQQTREIMQAELTRIWTETRKTVLFVTHQIDEAVYLSDRVLIFTVRPGRLKQDVLIELPRPRPLSIKRTPEFVHYTDLIWRAIEQEVRDGLVLDAQQRATGEAAGMI